MRHRITYIVSLLFALTIVATARVATAREKPWIEVRSPHFRVLTDGSANDGRQVALDFEKMRYVFATQFPKYRLESGAPLLIFAAQDLDSAKIVDPGLKKTKNANMLTGFYTHGWEEQFALVRLDTMSSAGEMATYEFKHGILQVMGDQPAFYDYTQSVIHMNAHWLPLWMDAGIAEFFSYTKFQGKTIVIGVPTDRFRVILFDIPIPIETLLEVDVNSPYIRDEDKHQLFLGESWALIHYLNFGPGMGGGAKLSVFFQMIQEGIDQKKAFVQVFGDFKTMDDALTLYMKRYGFATVTIPAPPSIDDKTFTLRTLSSAETEAEMAGYQIRNHQIATARPLVAEALQDDPKLGFAHEENGFLLFQDGKTAEAADEFSKAYELDPSLYLSLYFKTMLSPLATSDAPADREAFRLALAMVVQLNPQFAPAYVQLSRLAVRAGNLKEALRLSLKSESLDPWRAGYHLQTGEIMLRMGRGADAAAIAEFVALRWHNGDHNEAVELWNAVPADQRPAGDAPKFEEAKDSQQVEGIVKSMSCDDEPKEPHLPGQGPRLTLTLDHGGETLTFREKEFVAGSYSDTLWYGGDHFNWCQNVDGLRAVVSYRPPSDATYSGELVSVEVRNDLPASPANAKPVAAPALTPAPAPAPANSAAPSPNH